MTENPPEWLLVAEKELGVCEIPGPKDNPRIKEYQKSVPEQKEFRDEIPWCSSFVNWVFQQVGIEGTGKATARSWLHWGLHIDKPKFGCVVVMRRGDTWQGHVGLYLGSTTPDTIRVLGGNQGNKVSIINQKVSSVIGYRWPKEE